MIAAVVLLRVGMFFLRRIAQGVPEPPPAGELRRMDRRYRCSICGAELRLVIAPDQDPVPPRHCMEEMDLIADRDE